MVFQSCNWQDVILYAHAKIHTQTVVCHENINDYLTKKEINIHDNKWQDDL